MSKRKKWIDRNAVAVIAGITRLRTILHDADALLIVPPFQMLKYPSLSVHLLQACAGRAGFRTQILYANLLLASILGVETYSKICESPMEWFAGERFFARCAFGLPPLGRRASKMFDANWVVGQNREWEIRHDFNLNDHGKPITLRQLRWFAQVADGYIDSVARVISERRYRIVGCTTAFEQTAASVALLNRIKTQSRDTITILGGANCEGEMAHGIASLKTRIDYIFSGDCEVTFVKFLEAIFEGSRPSARVLFGEMCRNLDALPTPAYAEFYEQLAVFLPGSQFPVRETEIPYETSRGCWWGQRHGCTFCGLNGAGMPSREKSPSRVVEELHSLLPTSRTRKVLMIDKIMPRRYFQDLLPRLAREFQGVTVFYEQKANISLEHAIALKRAGISAIGPGVESLSSRLLTLMNKGVQARQNLMLLRYARSVDLDIYWFLLWGFPGDDVEAYEETIAILPLLHHLQPPRALIHLSIERFSPYFARPAEFAVRSIKPLAGYFDYLPRGCDVRRIACHFTAQYPCGSHDHVEVIHELWKEMKRWRAAWKKKRGTPELNLMVGRTAGAYVLIDSRDLWRKKRSYLLNEKEAAALATARPLSRTSIEQWALSEKLAVCVDDWFVPLTVAKPEVLLGLTHEGDHNVPASEDHCDIV